MKARVGCIFLLILSVPGAASAQAKPEKEKIRIGYAARVVAHSIPYLAAQAVRDAGYLGSRISDLLKPHLASRVVSCAGLVFRVSFALLYLKSFRSLCKLFDSYSS